MLRGYGVVRFTQASMAAIMLMTVSGCSLFQTRDPEPPDAGRGTYLQPDTPDRVVENIRFAISERNTRNYRRSLADELAFQPTATAESRDPIWGGWNAGAEESYFAGLVSSVAAEAGMSLELNDETLTAIDASRFVFDATYVLTANHNRPETPRNFQGRLAWELVQQQDGLWSLTSWTDREIGNEPSWSDLKAAFSS